MACLLLEAFLITTIPVAAFIITTIPVLADSTDDNYYFPSSNVNGSLFSNYGNPEYYSDTFSLSDFAYYQMEFSTSTILSCNNGSFPQALSSQGRLHGRSTSVYSAHTYLNLSLYFRLYFVISGDDFCSKSNGSTPSYYLSLVAYSIYRNVDSRVVWTANVGNPVGENACLLLTPDDSNLRLVDYDRNASVVWPTNTSG